MTSQPVGSRRDGYAIDGCEQRVYALDQYVSWRVVFGGRVAEGGSRSAETFHRHIEDGAHSCA